MDTQNQKGQALVEMALVTTFFLIFWIFVQKGLDQQKQKFKKWKIGYGTKVEYQKNYKK